MKKPTVNKKTATFALIEKDKNYVSYIEYIRKDMRNKLKLALRVKGRGSRKNDRTDRGYVCFGKRIKDAKFIALSLIHVHHNGSQQAVRDADLMAKASMIVKRYPLKFVHTS